MPWRASDQSFSLQPQSAQFPGSFATSVTIKNGSKLTNSPDLDLSYYWPTNNEAVQFGYTSPIGDEPLRDGVGEVASGSTPQSGFPHVGYTIHQIESHILPPNRAPCAPIEPSPKRYIKLSFR